MPALSPATGSNAWDAGSFNAKNQVADSGSTYDNAGNVIQSPTGQTTRATKAALLAQRERLIRDRFRKRIESLPTWAEFSPRNAFAAENHLQTRADYSERLVLHLPEIYAETIRLEGRVKEGQNEGALSDSCLAELIVGLEHVAHHASYCRHALEILSYEDSWRSWNAESLDREHRRK